MIKKMRDFLYLLFFEYNFLKFVNETGGGLAWYRLMFFSKPYNFFPECIFCIDLIAFEEMVAIHTQVNEEIRLLLHQTNNFTHIDITYHHYWWFSSNIDLTTLEKIIVTHTEVNAEIKLLLQQTNNFTCVDLTALEKIIVIHTQVNAEIRLLLQ